MSNDKDKAETRCPRCGGAAAWVEEAHVRRDTGEPRSVLAGPVPAVVGLLGLVVGGPALARTAALLRLFRFRGDVRGDLVSALLLLLIGARTLMGAVREWRAWEGAAKTVRRRYACEACGHAWERRPGD